MMTVLLNLLLAACASSLPQKALPATPLIDVDGGTEIAAIDSPTDTPAPTASSVEMATETPAPDTPTPLPTETPAPQTYIVQDGDNLWRIAEEFQTSVNAIQIANELVDGSIIYAGQELVIPSTPDNTEVPLPTAESAETVVETAESSTMPESPGTAAALPTETAFPDVTGDLTVTPISTAIPEIAEDAPAERDVLPNYILCPAEEDIKLEGGAIIGKSAVCGIPIVSYQLGYGETTLILIGGIHGGYEWNTILLAYQILDFLDQNPDVIPPSLTIYLIPNANPDGLYAVTQRIGRFTAADLAENTVPGRFNGNYVDLNRNWDCDWTPNALWRDNPISGGSAPFSEPENQLLRDFIIGKNPAAALFLHSAATGVYVSGCGQVDPVSKMLGEIYSDASGYPLYDGFFYYDVTGDAGDWLATQGIPSITVELSTHETLDWNMNLLGMKALFNHLAAGGGGSE